MKKYAQDTRKPAEKDRPVNIPNPTPHQPGYDETDKRPPSQEDPMQGK